MEDVAPGDETNSYLKPLGNLPSPPTTPPRGATNDIQDFNPSFIMDWLEKINIDHLDFARLLPTPRRDGQNYTDCSVSSTSSSAEVHSSTTSELESTARKISTPSKRTMSCVRKLNLSPSIHSFRKQSIMIGNGWNAKGLAKAQEGKWGSALSCWENALEIRQQVLGGCHSDVANTWNNIGIALGKLQRFEEAFTAMQESLKLRIEQNGSEKHTEIAATYHNLANIHQQAQNYQEALKLLETSLAISQSISGKKDIQVARTRMAIGHVHYEAGQFLEARDAYRKALGVMELCHRTGDRCGLDCSVEMEQCHQDIHDIEGVLRKTSSAPINK